ncbi:hypothetical protein LCGC14_2583630 [marine sediment metagenome]|uniref:Uncharacterized protein n=1 Tax=marine sediment metagenome TaxID=412755 RepID=A0A0F9D6F8_9ZZZZ
MEEPNMASWMVRLAEGKTTGKGGGKKIAVSLSSRGWSSRAYPTRGGYLHIVVGGNPIAELPVEPNLRLTFELETTGIAVKENDHRDSTRDSSANPVVLGRGPHAGP